jgi:hypothetical protein
MRTLMSVSTPVLVLFALLGSATASAADMSVPDSITELHDGLRDFPREQLEDDSARRAVDGAERKMQKALLKLGSGKKNALKSAVKVTAGAVKKLEKAGADESFAEVQGVVDVASAEIERMSGAVAARLAEDEALAAKYTKKLAKVVKKVERAQPALDAGEASKYLKKAGGLLAGLEKLLEKVGQGNGGGPPLGPNAGKGRAVLGPIAGAGFEIYLVSDLAAGPVVTGITTSGAIDEAGRAEVDPGLFTDAALYLVVVSGGEDIDADDDGVADAVPTPVNGKVHAVLTGAQIKAGDWRVSVLTEVAYQSILFMLQAGYDDAAIIEALDQAASRLVKSDLTGDGKVDSDDLNTWDPVRFTSLTLLSEDQKTELVGQIHAGEDTSASALESTSGFLGKVGSLPRIWDIEVVGSMAYLATDQGLRVVDVANPVKPRQIGELSIGEGFQVAVSGITALLSTRSGVREIGVEQPLAPHSVWLHSALSATAMVGVGDLFYIVTSDSLEVLDVSYRTDEDPETTEPVIVDSIPIDGRFAHGAYVAGGRLYVMWGFSVTAFDISTPGSPTEIRTFSVNGATATMSGDLHLALDGLTPRRSKLIISDFSEPLQPQTLATLPLPTTTASHIIVHGNTAYIFGGLSVIPVDISTPAQPVVLGRVYLGDEGTTAFGIYGSNRPYALVGRWDHADEIARLDVFDVADPSSAAPWGAWSLSRSSGRSPSAAAPPVSRAGSSSPWTSSI